MNIEQKHWTQEKGWEPSLETKLGENADLVFLFGGRKIMSESERFAELKKVYPNAKLMGCSTSGEIYEDGVWDDSLTLTAVHFEKTKIKKAHKTIENMEDSYKIAESLAKELIAPDLKHVFVLSEGLNVNGSELVKGFAAHLPKGVALTGGLSGDGADFKETRVLWAGSANPNTIVAIGLYGKDLKVGYGSLGGWDPFGPEREVTKAKGNILYELDGKSALELYKKYLGEHAKGLPATGLLFPLSLRQADQENKESIVRTILAVDDKAHSMTFAGDIPEGAIARLMKANFDRLIDGAMGAAQHGVQPLSGSSPELAILISCVGRKLILKQRVEEEIEGVRNVLGEKPVFTGFYSYGEISPLTPDAKCELHNQTMTITIFSEGS